MKNSKKNGKHGSNSGPSEPLGYTSTGNVFKDLGFRDGEFNKLSIKSELMFEISSIIRDNKWTQSYAAEQLGVAQPRISELKGANMDRFTIDILLRYLNRLGKEARLAFHDLKESKEITADHETCVERRD
jgi:predicted XRE-type DNA-binding protein